MTTLQDGLMTYDEWIVSVKQHVALDEMDDDEILEMYFDEMDKVFLKIGINALAVQTTTQHGNVGAKGYDN